MSLVDKTTGRTAKENLEIQNTKELSNLLEEQNKTIKELTETIKEKDNQIAKLTKLAETLNEENQFENVQKLKSNCDKLKKENLGLTHEVKALKDNPVVRLTEKCVSCDRDTVLRASELIDGANTKLKRKNRYLGILTLCMAIVTILFACIAIPKISNGISDRIKSYQATQEQKKAEDKAKEDAYKIRQYNIGVKDATLNIYKQADQSDADKIGYLSKGDTTVAIGDAKNGFQKILWNNQEGFVLSSGVDYPDVSSGFHFKWIYLFGGGIIVFLIFCVLTKKR